MLRSEVRVTAYLLDRGGNTGQVTVRLPSVVSLPDALTYARDNLAPRLRAISNAEVVTVEASIRTIETDPDTASGVALDRRALLIWRNEEGDLASILLPAVTLSLSMLSSDGEPYAFDLAQFSDFSTAVIAIGAIDRNGVTIDGDLLAAALVI
jgi:hypothetical protein